MNGTIRRSAFIEHRLSSITGQLNGLYAQRAAIKSEPVKVGDTAICSECLQEKTIVHLFGEKYPHCEQCDRDIRN